MEILFASMVHEGAAAHVHISPVLAEQRVNDAQRELDDHIASLFATRTGIGAVVIDHLGHVKLIDSRDGQGNCGYSLEPGLYPSIQAAIDAAADGDAIYIAAGTYREQLTIRGKQIDLLGSIGSDGSSLVTLEGA